MVEQEVLVQEQFLLHPAAGGPEQVPAVVDVNFFLVK